jgi:hypothetical protein
MCSARRRFERRADFIISTTQQRVPWWSSIDAVSIGPS